MLQSPCRVSIWLIQSLSKFTTMSRFPIALPRLSRLRRFLLLTVCLGIFGPGLLAAQTNESRVGIRPVDADGKPLNLDFESGSLDHWTSEGDAFLGQPIHGDTVFPRRSDMHSSHEGEFWIGTYERLQDSPQGTLTSNPFKVSHPFASFKIAGGSHEETRVEIVLSGSQEVIFRASGENTEDLKAISVDLSKHLGQEVFIRVIDQHSGPWGHINFDGFLFHERRPEVLVAENVPKLDVISHAGLTAEEAARAMTVPQGFHVTLFAGEPAVRQPIGFCLDDRGRLWVAEAYSYPIKLPPDQARDQILIFEDTNGDGKFDERKVFAQNLNLVSGIEVGFGGVWIGAAPEFLFIPDRNGDDVPDGEPEVLLDGWGYQDSHETLNAFIWGPDGWLYGCHGVFTHSFVGKPGAPDNQRKRINAGIWRYHPTRHEFEVFAEGTSNPWGVDFDDHGQAFCTACVIPHLYHIIQGARYQRQAGQHFNPYTYADIQTIARHRHWIGATPHAGNGKSDAAGGGHAHSGAMIYLGGTWPDGYRDQLFMNNIHGARINVDRLEHAGSGYAGDRAPDFLFANDSWSQIMNLQYGPDGQVYMIDWYDENQCHHGIIERHDRTNGRIFKVSYGEKTATNVDLIKLPDAELVQLQLHENDWYVRHARRILQERGPNPAVHEMLMPIAMDHPDVTRRLRALWAMHVTQGLTTERLLTALRNDSEWVRAWGIQFAVEQGEPAPDVLDRFEEIAVYDTSPVVRLYLASALQRLPLDLRFGILSWLTQYAADESDHNLPLMYWYAAEPLVEHFVNGALQLAKDSRIELVRRFLIRRSAQLKDPQARDLLVEWLGTAPSAVRNLILQETIQGLAGQRELSPPSAWKATYARLRETASAEERQLWDALGVTFGDANAVGNVRRIVSDPKASPNARLDAIETLVRARDAELPNELLKLLDVPELRGTAVRALSAFDDSRIPQTILSRYATWSFEEKRDALGTLAARKESALAMLNAVSSKEIPAQDLSAELVRQLRNLKDQEINQRVREVWGELNDTPEEKARLIGHYRRLFWRPPTSEPDLTLGRAIFTKTCSKCHKLFDYGGKVGPELTGSNRINLEYVLSNVLDPSAVIGKDYIAQIFNTKDGRTITGLVTKEDANSLTIATATETVLLPVSDIEERQPSALSMMPDDLWKNLSEDEVRGLVAYLASPAQTDVAATADTVTQFFNGQDLAMWKGSTDLWRIENREIIGTSKGLDHNEFLRSEIIAGDFHFSCETLLKDNQGNSGIQFRSAAESAGEIKGYQADMGVGWWGKLYEENGRGLLVDSKNESLVRPGAWNRYEIIAKGHHIELRINGKLTAELDDPEGAARGFIALQLHAGEPMEVRFRNLKLELIRE